MTDKRKSAPDEAMPNVAETDGGERPDYVIAGRPSPMYADDNISIGLLVRRAWEGKLLILFCTALVTLSAIVYALIATEWFRSEVLLVPSDDESSSGISAQFGGLASLAGIDLGNGGTAEPLAVLRSREFAGAFVSELSLMPVFFSDQWDAEKRRWRETDPNDHPDIRDAVKYFHEHILRVRESEITGLVTVAVEWKDPQRAAEWAAQLVERLNQRMRQRSLQEAKANVEYLRAELAKTNVLTVQQTIGHLLESELQKLMLARGREEFAFRIIDPAVAPKEHFRPKRVLVVLLGALLGGLLGLFVVLVLGSNPNKSDARATEFEG